VGARLGTEMILPEHAGVANAIGAVVGRVTIRRAGTVTAPGEGRYRIHLDSGPQDFTQEDEALTALSDHLLREARDTAIAAGAEDIQHKIAQDIRKAQAEGREVFLEAEITVEVSGRPRIAA
ncbi:MAG TPA: hydantoinase, partial [Roseovarius nubinhibens]|nr:hydantoinase [Roseovarius nubinhibens]